MLWGVCEFRQGVGRVSQMIEGILLYTREVGEVHYGVWGECLIARVLFLIPVWREAMSVGVLWG